VPALALLLDDPARDIAPKIRANARQHGLTAVETELACRLADGRTVDEAASDQRISVHTARKCLQQIFAKTSTSRQAELVRVPISGTVPRAALKAVLPRATVWPVLGRAAYLERLNACDMTLRPFPFGRLRSTIDSLSQGLPVVAMAGESPMRAPTRRCCASRACPAGSATAAGPSPAPLGGGAFCSISFTPSLPAATSA